MKPPNNPLFPKIRRLRFDMLALTPSVLPRAVLFILLPVAFFFLVGCVVNSPPDDSLTVTTRLIPLLQDPNPDIRRTAAVSLGKIANPLSEPFLIEALDDPDPLVRGGSAWALGQLGEEVSDEGALALVARIGDKETHVKEAVAGGLGKIGARPGVVELLLEVLAVGERESRRVVVEVLAQLESPQAFQALVAALEDESPRVRQGSVAALGELGDLRALPFIRKRLLRDPDVGVRTEAAYRLGKMGQSEDRRALQKAAETDPDPLVHLWATWALQNIEIPKSEEG